MGEESLGVNRKNIFFHRVFSIYEVSLKFHSSPVEVFWFCSFWSSCGNKFSLEGIDFILSSHNHDISPQKCLLGLRNKEVLDRNDGAVHF